MGSFANTLFSVLLGWVQSAVSWLWQIVNNDGADGFMGWVLEHWLLLAILLCAAGVFIDLVVYLYRWQPYRVWRSFWRRVSGREEAEALLEAEQAAEAAQARQWIFADGSTTVETPAEQPAPEILGAETGMPETDMQLKAPVRPVRRVIPARRRRAADGSDEYLLPDLGGVKQAYHQPYYPPQWHSGEQKKIDEGDKT